VINFSLQQDWWLLASMLALAFGVGFWGGVLQHAHQNAGDGGTLDLYARVLFRTVSVVTDVGNTVVATTVASFIIPANTVPEGRGLRLTAHLVWRQNTGLPQNEPSIRWGMGALFFGHVGNTTAFATNVNERSIQVNFRIMNVQAGAGIKTLGGNYDFLDAATGAGSGLVPVIARSLGGDYGGFDWTVDQTWNLVVTNAVANAGYITRFRAATIELI
jgi:hypothetical protein